MKKIFSILLIILFASSIVFSENIKTSIRIIGNPSQKQIEFINNNFDYVMTPFLSEDIRNMVTKPKLFLYRSIQGTWEGFNQFDWEHINSNENMFCHSDSSNQSAETRILTIWNSWLMNGNDLVDKTAVDVMNHWINYYAVTASTQVYTYNYDGLFIDSAGHRLGEGAVNGNMPWDYSSDKWRDARYAALSFIKSYLPDKTVIFNGLHSDNGADSSLSLTDGGMWEDFTFDINNGSYKGEKKWYAAITCLGQHNKNSNLILVVKKTGLINDINARIFSVASYLLISSPNVSLSLSDWNYAKQIQYYPEYEIDLGNPIDEYTMQSDSLFVRYFEHGMVLVNPFSINKKKFTLSKSYFKIIPQNGGIIDSEGNYTGELSYENINGEIEIPPVSSYILSDKKTTSIGNENNDLNVPVKFELFQNYPNPFNPTTTIRFDLSKEGNVTLTVYNVMGEVVATLVDKKMTAGKHRVNFDASQLSSGIYFYQMNTDSFVDTKKLILLK